MGMLRFRISYLHLDRCLGVFMSMYVARCLESSVPIPPFLEFTGNRLARLPSSRLIVTDILAAVMVLRVSF